MITTNSLESKALDFSSLSLERKVIEEVVKVDVSLLNKINIKPQQITIKEVEIDRNQCIFDLKFESYGVTLKEYCESKNSLRNKEIISILWHITNGEDFYSFWTCF